MGYARKPKMPLSDIAIIDTGTIEEIAAQVPPQDISGKVDKVTGQSLVADSEIVKIHSNILDHEHTNKSTLESIQVALTTTLKLGYDSAVDHSQSSHAPSNAQKNSDITKAEIEAKLTGELTSHSHAGGSGGLTQQQILRLI